MILGRRSEQQKSMWFSYDRLPQSEGQVLYLRLQKLLYEEAFDAFPKKLCAPFSADKPGRRSISSGRSCRMLLIGCFGGIDSGPGICRRSSQCPVPAGILGPCPR